MKTIFKCRSGSHLYGLNRPESDIDFSSVYLPNARDLLVLIPTDTVDSSTKQSYEKRRNTADDVDDIGYSLTRFIELSLKNNPTILSFYFATSDNILYIDPVFRTLMDSYPKIVSRRAIGSFFGYAISQKDKLTVKASRYFSLQRAMEYLETNCADKLETEDSIEAVADQLNSILSYYKNGRCMCNSFNKGNNYKSVYTMIKREFSEYGWRVETADFKRLNYDPKYAYHMIRLLGEAEMVMKEGRIIYPIVGELKDQIIKIRSGEVLYDELMAIYEERAARCRELETTCTLPEEPDWEWANNWLADTLERHIVEEYEAKHV